jgi:hypothetical protein
MQSVLDEDPSGNHKRELDLAICGQAAPPSALVSTDPLGETLVEPVWGPHAAS